MATPPVRGFEGLGQHAGAVLAAIAVLGEDAQIALTAHVAELGLQETLAAVDLLTGAGIVAHSVPLAFLEEHTTQRVLNGMSVARTIATRIRAAEQLRGIPGAAERAAGQLMHIGPVGLDWAPEALRVAAAQAMDRGDWRVAADYLHHALAERLPAARRMKASWELAQILSARDPRAAVTCLLQELRLHDSPVDVVEITRLLRRLATWLPNTPDVTRLFSEAADHLCQHDPDQAVRLQLTRTSFMMYRPEGAVLLSELESWLTQADLTNPFTQRALTATRACLAALREPRGGDAVRLAQEVLDTAKLRQEWDTCWMALSALLVSGHDEITEEACRRLDATLPATGAEIQRFGCDLTQAYLRRRRGDLRGTVETLRRVLTGCAAFGLTSTHTIVATAAGMSAEALVWMGEVDKARRMLADHDLLGDLSHTGMQMCLLTGRGAVAAATDDLEQALTDQLDCGRIVTAWTDLNSDFHSWRIEAVRTLLRLSRPDDAVVLAEADRAAAQAWGSVRAKGFAAHCLALTTGSAELYAEAAELFSECGAELAEAQARHDLAEALDAEHRCDEAAGQRARAQELAEKCGAGLIAARRPVNAPVLTAQEQRITHLVRQGLGNAEIAEQLSIARRTVEFHLSGVYRKLGISGRRELMTWNGEV